MFTHKLHPQSYKMAQIRMAITEVTVNKRLRLTNGDKPTSTGQSINFIINCLEHLHCINHINIHVIIKVIAFVYLFKYTTVLLTT